MPIRQPAIVAVLVAGAAGLAAAAPAPAPGAWWDRAAEAQVGHYWIKTDLPAADANALARHLNVMHEEYARRLAALPPREPVALNVLIFADQGDYLETLYRKFGIDASGTGGMFLVTPSGRGLAFFAGGVPERRVMHVAQHEGFHQFAYSRFGSDLPPWVNEGLAEFFGESVVVAGKVVIGQSSARVIESVKASIEAGSYVPLADMLGMSPHAWAEALGSGSAAPLYHQAWSMVHFLVYGDEGRYVGSFEQYLRLLNAGFPSDAAFVRAFKTDDIDAFEARWKEYALALEPSALVTALDRIEFLAEGALELDRRGILPESLDALRADLREIGFTHRLDRHGVAVEQRPDDSLFEIPFTGDPRIEQRPVFVVSRPRPHTLKRRQRHLEELAPTPSQIESRFLKPCNVAVRWIRDEATNEFTYDIVVESD